MIRYQEIVLLRKAAFSVSLWRLCVSSAPEKYCHALGYWDFRHDERLATKWNSFKNMTVSEDLVRFAFGAAIGAVASYAGKRFGSQTGGFD